MDHRGLSEAARESGMQMLVVFGSRVRGQVHAHSDWDFGFLASVGADIDRLRGKLSEIVGTDAIDLVDLARGGALLRMQVATEGKPLFESAPGAFLQFQDETARFWCEVEPVLSSTYARILEKARAA